MTEQEMKEVEQHIKEVFIKGDLCCNCKHHHHIREKGNGKDFILQVRSECDYDFKNIKYDKEKEKGVCKDFEKGGSSEKTKEV